MYGDNELLAYQAGQALKSFLERQSGWDIFFTATFRNPIKYPGTAISKTAKAVFRYLNPARGFIAAEQHQSGFWHTHGLVAYKEQFSGDFAAGFKIKLAKIGLDKLGWASIGSPRDVGGVAGYCSKYITKKNPVDWMIYGKDWKKI